jgi:hypothetical protein
MANINFPFWQGVRKLLVDMLDGTYAERVEAYPPKVLMTDNNGDYARLRVDVAQTGFFAGREFRSFLEFTVLDNTELVIKVVAGCNTIVQQLAVDLTLSQIKFELRIGGTESGTFSTALPVFKTNGMTTASNYASQVTLAYGGTQTGGTLVDSFEAVSGSNVNKAVVQSVTENLPVGFSAGTYYLKIINTNGATALGILKLRWEERP